MSFVLVPRIRIAFCAQDGSLRWQVCWLQEFCSLGTGSVDVSHFVFATKMQGPIARSKRLVVTFDTWNKEKLQKIHWNKSLHYKVERVLATRDIWCVCVCVCLDQIPVIYQAIGFLLHICFSAARGKFVVKHFDPNPLRYCIFYEVPLKFQTSKTEH